MHILTGYILDWFWVTYHLCRYSLKTISWASGFTAIPYCKCVVHVESRLSRQSWKLLFSLNIISKLFFLVFYRPSALNCTAYTHGMCIDKDFLKLIIVPHTLFHNLTTMDDNIISLWDNLDTIFQQMQQKKNQIQI